MVDQSNQLNEEEIMPVTLSEREQKVVDLLLAGSNKEFYAAIKTLSKNEKKAVQNYLAIICAAAAAIPPDETE